MLKIKKSTHTPIAIIPLFILRTQVWKITNLSHHSPSFPPFPQFPTIPIIPLFPTYGSKRVFLTAKK